MGRTVRYVKDHDFYCTQCGKKGIPVCRTTRKTREAGHLKKLFCMTCNTETNHVECVSGTKYSLEDFLSEFESGNFNDDGTRKMSLSDQHIMENEYVEAGIEDDIEEWLELFSNCV